MKPFLGQKRVKQNAQPLNHKRMGVYIFHWPVLPDDTTLLICKPSHDLRQAVSGSCPSGDLFDLTHVEGRKSLLSPTGDSIRSDVEMLG